MLYFRIHFPELKFSQLNVLIYVLLCCFHFSKCEMCLFIHLFCAGLNPNQCLKSCLGCGGCSVTVCWNSVGLTHYLGFPSSSAGENLPAVQETQEIWVCSLGWDDPIEEEMATHSSILAWRILWTGEPDVLLSSSVQFSRSVVSDSFQPRGL